MLDQILEACSQGITLIEEDISAVNLILAKQIGTYAAGTGKKVCYLTLTEESEGVQQREMGGLPAGAVRDVGESYLVDDGSIALKVYNHLMNLEDLKFDLIVFEFFSSHLFERTERETVEVLNEIKRLASAGRSFVLTSENGMLSAKTNAYLRSMCDNILIIRTEILRDKIERMLYIARMRGMKPMDNLVKFTLREDGIEIDTREFLS